MVFEVYRTETFDKEMNKLENEYQERIQNLFLQLKVNPYLGDPLRSKVLREKRLDEKRLYFLVFEDLNSVLFVAIGNKKTQQKTIDCILELIDEYKIYLKKLLGKV